MNYPLRVIDTIVEWIDDNLHQPLRIDDAAMPGIRNGICNGCFYSTKGKVSGATFASVNCCWRRATCEIPTSGFMISA